MATIGKSSSSLSRIKDALGLKKPDVKPENTKRVKRQRSLIDPFTDEGRRKIAPPSGYKQETRRMGNVRRNQEQSGHRGLGIRVQSNERSDEEPMAMEQSLENQSSLMNNPLLDTQRFDGIDPSVNPAPALNTAARTEFDNIKREQEMEKQLRLGLAPGNTKKFNPRFTPGG